MRIPPETSSVQIVLIGDFLPDLFSPPRLVQYGVLGEKDAATSEQRIVSELVTDFSTDWCRVFVTQERFVLMSQQAPWVRLSDFTTKVFAEALPETKTQYLGINRVVEFSAGSAKVLDLLGRSLAPRRAWGEWGEKLEAYEGLNETGLATMTMRQVHDLHDRKSGHIEARISAGSNTSVVMNINDHYAHADHERSVDSTKKFVSILERQFEKSIKRSELIVDGIMAQVQKWAQTSK